MTEAIIDISSLIRLQSQRERQHEQRQQNTLTKRYQLPEHYYPSYLQHPNQPFSSPSLSVSSSPSSSSLSSYDQEECEEESIVNESSSAISVDGEFDVRIEMIRPSPEQKIHSQIQRSRPGPASPASPASPNVIAGVRECACASAPPLSEDEFENENANDYPQPQPQQPQPQQPQQQQPQQQKQEKEEEVCVCVICYETFEEPVELIRGRNYTSEELEEIEGKEKITNFCQTCKYNVRGVS